MKKQANAQKILLLIIFQIGLASALKDCFCAKRVDGYSRNALQLYFLDYGKRSSVETLIDQLTARYNSIVGRSRKSFPRLPYLTKIGEGVSIRNVFANSSQRKKQGGRKTVGLKAGIKGKAAKKITSAKKVTQFVDFKRVYDFGGQTFYFYYYPVDKNRVTWTIQFTNAERLADKNSPISKRKKVRPFDKSLLLKKEQINKGFENLGNWQAAGRKGQEFVGSQARIDQFKLKKLSLPNKGTVRQQYTLSHYMEHQFEFDLCVNFQIFVDKMLRNFFGFGVEKHPKFGTPLFGISSLLLTKKNKCLKIKRKYADYVPADFTRLDKRALQGLIKSSINFEVVYKNAGRTGIYDEAVKLLASSGSLGAITEKTNDSRSSDSEKPGLAVKTDLVEQGKVTGKKTKDRLPIKPEPDLLPKDKLSAQENAKRGRNWERKEGKDLSKRDLSSLEEDKEQKRKKSRTSSVLPGPINKLIAEKKQQSSKIESKGKNEKNKPDFLNKEKKKENDFLNEELKNIFAKDYQPKIMSRRKSEMPHSVISKEQKPKINVRSGSVVSKIKGPSLIDSWFEKDKEKSDFLDNIYGLVQKQKSKPTKIQNTKERKITRSESKQSFSEKEKPNLKAKKIKDFGSKYTDEDIVEEKKPTELNDLFKNHNFKKNAKQPTYRKFSVDRSKEISALEKDLQEVFNKGKLNLVGQRKFQTGKNRWSVFKDEDPYNVEETDLQEKQRPRSNEVGGVTLHHAPLFFTPADNGPIRIISKPSKPSQKLVPGVQKESKPKEGKLLADDSNLVEKGEILIHKRANKKIGDGEDKIKTRDEIFTDIKRRTSVNFDLKKEIKPQENQFAEQNDLSSIFKTKTPKENPLSIQKQQILEKHGQVPREKISDKNAQIDLKSQKKPAAKKPRDLDSSEQPEANPSKENQPKFSVDAQTNLASNPPTKTETRDQAIQTDAPQSLSFPASTPIILNFFVNRQNFISIDLLKRLPKSVRSILQASHQQDDDSLSYSLSQSSPEDIDKLFELFVPMLEDSREKLQTSPDQRLRFDLTPLDLSSAQRINESVCQGLEPISHEQPVITHKMLVEVEAEQSEEDEQNQEELPALITGEITKALLAVNPPSFDPAIDGLDGFLDEEISSDPESSFMIDRVNEEVFGPAANLSLIRDNSINTSLLSETLQSDFLGKMRGSKIALKEIPANMLETSRIDLRQTLLANKDQNQSDSQPSLILVKSPLSLSGVTSGQNQGETSFIEEMSIRDFVEKRQVAKNMVGFGNHYDVLITQSSFISDLQSIAALSELREEEPKPLGQDLGLSLLDLEREFGQDEPDEEGDLPPPICEGQEQQDKPTTELDLEDQRPEDFSGLSSRLVMRPELAVFQDMEAIIADGLLAPPGKTGTVVFDSAKDSVFMHNAISHQGNVPLSDSEEDEPDSLKLLRLDFHKKVRFVGHMVKLHATLLKNTGEEFAGAWFRVFEDLTVSFSSSGFESSLLVYVLSYYQYQLVISEVVQNSEELVVTVEDHIRFHNGQQVNEVVIRHREELPGLESEDYQTAIKSSENARASSAGKKVGTKH